jgi:hypothetical protein
MNPDMSALYNCPDPLLPGTISPATLDKAWDYLSMGPCGLDAETIAGLLSLVADAALKISYNDLFTNAVLDAELFYYDAIIHGDNTCRCDEHQHEGEDQ